MYDPRAIAIGVSRWTGLGVELPKELAGAIETFEALLYTEVEYPLTFDEAGVTAANAESKIRELAEELTIQQVIAEAKTKAVNEVARRVIRLARAAVPDVIEQLTPEFNERAEAYQAAVSKLPEELTAETLVAAGADAVTAYGQAQQEAHYLNGISSWVAGTGPLGFGNVMYPVLRILRPTSPMELIKLEEAHQQPANPTLAPVNPVLYRAARMGVEFGINTLTECAEISQRLETLGLQAAAAAFG